jgi:hypothetical protein
MNRLGILRYVVSCAFRLFNPRAREMENVTFINKVSLTQRRRI